MPTDPQDIVEALRAAGRPLKAKELARALELPDDAAAALRDQLTELDASGVVHRLPGQRFAAPHRIELRTARLQGTRGGAAFAITEDDAPDIYIGPDSLGTALHGDRVTVRVDRRTARPQGRVVEVLERARSRITGIYREPRPGRGARAAGGLVEPEDRRMTGDVGIIRGGQGSAADGDVVIVRITDWGSDERGPRGEVEEVLGKPDDPAVRMLRIVRQYGLPTGFPDAALREAEAIGARGVTDADVAGREDFRGTLVFTIDPADAKDHDDALSIERLEDGWRVGVHIADVSHYVAEDSGLDDEAYARGTSVYLVDRVVPMLPHALSSGLCSLVPDQDRLTLSLLLELDEEAAVRASRLVRGVIRSRHRLSYEQAQEVLDGTGCVDEAADEALRLLGDVARKLRVRREARGSLDLDLPEARVILDEEGTVSGIVAVERLESHRLVEDFMLLANETVAEYAKAAKIPFLYRVHEPPDVTRVEQLREFLAGIGIRLGGRDGARPRDFQAVLRQAESRPDRALISTVLLRSLKQARYAEHDLGHFGLAARGYTHFTSPIRRYPDLVVHRIATGVLIDGEAPWLDEEELAEIGRTTSDAERQAAAAERDSRELKKVEYMERHVGDEFDGTIAGVTGFGFFVLLDDVYVEGLVHVSSLRDDFYVHLEDQHALEGERTRRRFRTGDRVRVTVAAADLEQRRIDLELAGRPESRRRAPQRRS